MLFFWMGKRDMVYCAVAPNEETARKLIFERYTNADEDMTKLFNTNPFCLERGAFAIFKESGLT